MVRKKEDCTCQFPFSNTEHKLVSQHTQNSPDRASSVNGVSGPTVRVSCSGGGGGGGSFPHPKLSNFPPKF